MTLDDLPWLEIEKKKEDSKRIPLYVEIPEEKPHEKEEKEEKRVIIIDI